MASWHETTHPRLAGDAQRPVPSCLLLPLSLDTSVFDALASGSRLNRSSPLTNAKCLMPNASFFPLDALLQGHGPKCIATAATSLPLTIPSPLTSHGQLSGSLQGPKL